MVYSINNYTANDMLRLSWEVFKTEWKDTNTREDMNIVEDFFMELKLRSQLSMTNVCCIALVALMFGVYRYALIRFIVKPITTHFKFDLTESGKFNESACRLSSYGLFFSMSYYLVNMKYPQLQYDLSQQWTEYSQTMAVPGDIQLLFMCESGYYFFAMYSTWYLDLWKKDSIAMLIHHVLANCLIIFSFAVRYHRIGLLVMYLHDGADVILEITKFINFFKKKVGWRLMTYLSNIGFVLFSYNWLWCRLVRYPQIVLFSSFYVARQILIGDVASFYFSFNAMLFFLLCLNIFWFHFIILLIMRIATGKTKELEDTREYSEREKSVKTTEESADTYKKEHSDTRNGLISNITKSDNGDVCSNGNGFVTEKKNGILKMKDSNWADKTDNDELTELQRRKGN